MPLPVIIIAGIAFSALELLIIACVIYLALVVWIKWVQEHPITFPSFSRTWDDYPVTIPPIPAPPQTRPAPSPAIPAPPVAVPIDEPIAIPRTKPRTRNRDKGIWNVYDLHFLRPATGRNYIRGKGYTRRSYFVGDIYKYGITSFKKTYLRYLIIQKIFPSDKGEYILEELNNKILGPFEWYLSNVIYSEANAEEVRLIEAYVAKYGEFPPGNTFKG